MEIISFVNIDGMFENCLSHCDVDVVKITSFGAKNKYKIENIPDTVGILHNFVPFVNLLYMAGRANDGIIPYNHFHERVAKDERITSL